MATITPQQQFSIEEMKVARSRIDQEIATMNNFEIVSVKAAIGAIYLIFFSQRITDQAALIVISALPSLCVAMVFFDTALTQVSFKFTKIT